MIISIGRVILVLPLLLVSFSKLSAQQPPIKVDSIQTNTKALIIGLDVWDKNHIWASGTNGNILQSTNGGHSWEAYVYEAVDTLQFRAIKALSATEALVMSSGEGNASQILKFSNKEGWQLLYEMPFEKGFLDAIEILPNGKAIAYGDAIDSNYFILLSDTSLMNWTRVTNTPNAAIGEGGFASSGTNIAVGEKGEVWIGTGAAGQANVLYSKNYGTNWTKIETPMIVGEAAGITAIRQQKDFLFITGGDLAVSDQYTNNLYTTSTNGERWEALTQPRTKGAFYGAATQKINESIAIIICGPKGADIKLSEDSEWKNLSENDLWTVEFISNNTALIAGRGGYMIRVEIIR